MHVLHSSRGPGWPRRQQLAARLATGLAGWTFLAPAWAQQALPPAAVPRPLEATPLQPSERPLPLTIPARPALAAPPGATVRVQRFVLSGNTQLSQAEIDPVLAPFVGRELGFAQLNAAADAVTALYRQRGWLLALAYLPQQPIRDGSVEIAVLEGRLGQIQLSPHSAADIDLGFLQSLASWRVAAGEPVGEANLVRNLLVLNDLPGLAVSADVRPGTAVGSADVQVDLQRLGPQTGGSVVLDNHGSRYTGRWRVGGNFFANNLAGRGDLLTLQAMTAQDSGQQSAALGYGLPVHASGTRLSAAVSAINYRIIEPSLSDLAAHGKALYLQATLDQPLQRRIDHALYARLALAHKAVQDRIDLVGQAQDRHIDSGQLSFAGDWRPAVAPGRQTTLSLAAEAGHVGFDNAQAELADAVQLHTRGRFLRFNLDASHLQPLGARWSVLTRLAVQSTTRNLDAANKVVLGGANVLRPWGDRATSVDEAVLGSVDLRYRVPAVALPGSLPGVQLSAFGDCGTGRVNRKPGTLNGPNFVNAATLGLGVEILLPKDMTVRIAAAQQAVVPRDDGSARWQSRGWLEWIKAL